MEDVIQKENEIFIQLKKKDTIKIGIKDENGLDTGEYLEFDVEDIEYPLLINKCTVEHQKNMNYAKMQLMNIDKMQDKKGKYALSKKDEMTMKVMNEFYDKEMKVLDMLLGENGCKKLLNGRKPYYGMFDDFVEILDPIMPILQVKKKEVNNKIKEKYAQFQLEGNVLE